MLDYNVCQRANKASPILNFGPALGLYYLSIKYNIYNLNGIKFELIVYQVDFKSLTDNT